MWRWFGCSCWQPRALHCRHLREHVKQQCKWPHSICIVLIVYFLQTLHRPNVCSGVVMTLRKIEWSSQSREEINQLILELGMHRFRFQPSPILGLELVGIGIGIGRNRNWCMPSNDELIGSFCSLATLLHWLTYCTQQSTWGWGRECR
jgi:sulfite exporter TauE/SafE